MRSSFPIAVASLLALSSSARAASLAPLPIQAGDYVIQESSCADPPFAAIFHFDGRNLSGPHSSHCHSRTLSRSGARFQIQTTCHAQGDGTPEPPETSLRTFRVLSPSRVQDLGPTQRASRAVYRRCDELFH